MYSSSNPLALFSCDGGLSAFPGYEDTTSNNTVSFSVLGGGQGLAKVFTCNKP